MRICLKCGSEVKGKGKYCSDACKQRNRTEAKPVTASLEDYQAHPGRYAKREHPEWLNWGPWLSQEGLIIAGFKANRTPMEGDWDYAGAVGPNAEVRPGWVYDRDTGKWLQVKRANK